MSASNTRTTIGYAVWSYSPEGERVPSRTWPAREDAVAFARLCNSTWRHDVVRITTTIETLETVPGEAVATRRRRAASNTHL